jgi:hypothetical protein
MDQEAPRARMPKWDAVILVCKECSKRRGAPKDAKPKMLAGDLRTLTKHDRSRARVVLSPCLGLCPKGAIAVTRVGGTSAASLVAIARRPQVEGWYVEATRPRGTPPSDDR